ncbi:MAG: S8 family serine peptidase [Acidobacteriota bacterium]
MTSYFDPADASHLDKWTLCHRAGFFFGTLIFGFVLFGLSTPLSAQEPPDVRAKSQAPPELRELFDVGEGLWERSDFRKSALKRRQAPPPAGLDASLLDSKSSAPVLVIAGWDRFPTAADWDRWRSLGLLYVDSLGHRLWLVELSGDAGDLFEATGASTFARYTDLDKVARALDRPADGDLFYDAGRDIVVVDVTLARSAPETQRNLREAFHVPGVEYVEMADELALSLVLERQSIAGLAARPEVMRIDPGAFRPQVLMDSVRPIVRGDDVRGYRGARLRGAGIRAANNEPFQDGYIHDGFWNHDQAGVKTTPRWTAFADQNCVKEPYFDPWHGLMTAGILLGNGWFSDRYTDDPEAFRGIAPEATLECYDEGGDAHVSSHSYIRGFFTNVNWDRSVVNERGDNRFHAHVAAAGNSGLGTTLRGLVNTSKNAMLVGNALPSGQINPQSSAGPTFDGRLKPDITAPTSAYGTYKTRVVSVQIARIAIERGGSTLVDWTFDADGDAWHLGWGQPPSNFGEVFLDATRLANGNMRIDTETGPFGDGWDYSPLIGTATEPSSDPAAPGPALDIQGQAGDTMIIEYRALPTTPQGLGYFDISPIWMRCYPNGSAGCIGYDFWYSQSGLGGTGIGDGTWRTLELPVGQATSTFIAGNPFWDDSQTWAGTSIQWLGLRFEKTELQPTPSMNQGYNRGSAGTSGASPVVGGAYALAMENFARLFPASDLDAQHHLSVFYAGSGDEPLHGMPFNSTWKALFIHTADDMVRENPPATVPEEPAALPPNVYHRGPDYTTGHGRINIQAGVDLLTQLSLGAASHRVAENMIRAEEYHEYRVEVGSEQVGKYGFAATLAWDDAPSSGGELVNHLGLILISPDGEVFHPWSLDIPPDNATNADILPARRDQPNDHDNVENVQVDLLKEDHIGVWTAIVAEYGIAGVSGRQKYSLIMSPIPRLKE